MHVPASAAEPHIRHLFWQAPATLWAASPALVDCRVDEAAGKVADEPHTGCSYSVDFFATGVT